MGFNARPAFEASTRVLAAKAVVGIGIIGAMFALVVGIWP